jgi:phosphoribosylformimino-5-aminoimidazole carboxamide ribotide isomerase
MIIFPAIDLYEGKAVRLFKGNYNEMTVYSDNPPEIAADFAAQGATHIHVVDLEGAKTGKTPNIDIISSIAKTYGLFTEVGGGIRSMEVIDRYIDSGVSRVILGTAAVTEEGFVEAAVKSTATRLPSVSILRMATLPSEVGPRNPSFSQWIFARKWRISA